MKVIDTSELLHSEDFAGGPAQMSILDNPSQQLVPSTPEIHVSREQQPSPTPKWQVKPAYEVQLK